MRQGIDLIPAGSAGTAPEILSERGAFYVLGDPEGTGRVATEASG